MDYQPRELTHACSRSDTEACDMCYVFNVNLTDSFDDRRSQCRLIEYTYISVLLQIYHHKHCLQQQILIDNTIL